MDTVEFCETFSAFFGLTSSFFRDSIPVSSYQIAETYDKEVMKMSDQTVHRIDLTCVPNIMDVNKANRRPWNNIIKCALCIFLPRNISYQIVFLPTSNKRKRIKTTVAGGLKKERMWFFWKFSNCPMFTCRSCSSSSLRVCKWWSDVRQEIDWNLMDNQLPQS